MKIIIKNIRNSFILCLMLLLSSSVHAQPAPDSPRGPMPPALDTPQEGIDPSFYEIPTPLPPLPTPTFEQMLQRDSQAFTAVDEYLDGCSYRLKSGYYLFLLGVVCPEEKSEDKDYGQLSLEYARSLLQGRPLKIRLVSEVTDTQIRQQVLRALAFLPNGVMVNEELLLQGLAVIDPRAELPEPLRQQLEKAQESAKRRRRGVWENSLPSRPVRRIVSESVEEATAVPLPELAIRPPVKIPDEIILKSGQLIHGAIISDYTPGQASAVVRIETETGDTIAVLSDQIETVRKIAP
jgi:endonuclease YncB( thermonuclease family)